MEGGSGWEGGGGNVGGGGGGIDQPPWGRGSGSLDVFESPLAFCHSLS